MRPRLVDWIFTIPFLICFGAILLVFDPLQRLAFLFGRRPQEIVAGALQVALVWAFRLSGTRIAVSSSSGSTGIGSNQRSATTWRSKPSLTKIPKLHV